MIQLESAYFVLPPVFKLVSLSEYSTLKMKALNSSETTVDFQRATRHYIPEESTRLTLFVPQGITT
jgi:hypothetical protein